MTTIWLLALLAMLPPFGVAVLAAMRGDMPQRLVAVQVAQALCILVLVLFTYASDQPSFIDLPLALSLLALPGGLMLAMFLERWL